MNSAFEKAKPVLREIECAGYEAYFVGGSVRDAVLGREINDVDIATSATPEEIMTLFPKHVPIGLQHGTVMVLHEEDSYEITTFRTEAGYEDFRRPSSVVFVRSLHEDLKRRDFTMNAIAMTREGRLLDPFNGEESIAKREIKTVGDAYERFSEDALRMMRGIRFVSTLGFSLEERTKEAIMKHGELLQHIAIERIAVEFEKLLTGSYMQKAMRLLIDTGLHGFLPGFASYEKEMYRICNYACTELNAKEEHWALLFYLMDVRDPGSTLRKWKLSNKEIKKIEKIVQGVYDIEENDWNIYSLYALGKEDAMSIERVRTILHNEPIRANITRIEKLHTSLPITSSKELAINGSDILAWIPKKGGPWVAELLHVIEREVVSGRLQNKQEKIREWVNMWDQK
ncbi:CCA tRNA nucleotidyltransferase [Priestia taiwanensis]|uniref:CCA-adding enzyme n=1 Tax=Priestia taiwanensis TaxID=1347902 RepID=A0A917EKB1_9BACI|nr:CCA tRNA nucleotidyltransferase [Priestia taiwanensis]MBM7361724.1 tRNA nucleotidyltransferase (CCA-adding enzyme) [Priestia taiwanensis]GGE56458.1 CCA-adding enzyme [Priestia taiwanensis]